jgi:hypothetical protein
MQPLGPDFCSFSGYNPAQQHREGKDAPVSNGLRRPGHIGRPVRKGTGTGRHELEEPVRSSRWAKPRRRSGSSCLPCLAVASPPDQHSLSRREGEGEGTSGGARPRRLRNRPLRNRPLRPRPLRHRPLRNWPLRHRRCRHRRFRNGRLRYVPLRNLIVALHCSSCEYPASYEYVGGVSPDARCSLLLSCPVMPRQRHSSVTAPTRATVQPATNRSVGRQTSALW